MKINEILSLNFVVPNLSSISKVDVLHELCDFLERNKLTKGKELLFDSLMERENNMSTGIGDALAVPHARVAGIERLTGVFGRSAKGIDFDSLDGQPVYFVFLLLIPMDSVAQHLKALAKIARLFSNSALRDSIRNADTQEEIYSLLIDADAKLN